jgi:hypothetical protein
MIGRHSNDPHAIIIVVIIIIIIIILDKHLLLPKNQTPFSCFSLLLCFAFNKLLGAANQYPTSARVPTEISL